MMLYNSNVDLVNDKVYKIWLNSVHSFLKLRLHYNELAQRTATVWRYLTFGDIRCYTLKKSDECDH